MDTSKKIVVVGANSYLARNMIFLLKKYGFCNIWLYGNQENQTDGWENYRKINICSREAMAEINFDCDYLYLFSGIIGTDKGFEQYYLYNNVNVNGMLNVLDEYRKQKSNAKIIFPSTRLVYKGSPEKLREDAEKEFKTIYALNKFNCEEILKMYHDTFEVSYTVFRICLPYGTMVPNIKSYGTAEFFASKGKAGQEITIYGDGSQRRTLTNIVDLSEVLIRAGMSEKCMDDVYNVGGNDELSIHEMAEVIADIYNVGVKPIEWPEMALKLESWDTVFDSEKLDGLMEYSYQYNFEEWAQEQKNK